MKKFILSFIISCLSVGLASAQETVTIDGIKYYLENGVATIMTQEETLSGDIVIPSTVSYNGIEYKVTNITSSAFKSTKINSIVLPDGITSLSNYCFYSCKSLSSITIPCSVTSLGNHCFAFCISMSSIAIPNSVTSFGDYCFQCCNSLSINIPNSVTSLGQGCFTNCTSLTSITIPSSVTSLGLSCFSGCSSLTSITIPNSVTSLGLICFSGCSNLVKVNCEWDNLDNVSCATNAFENIFSEAKLYVPIGTTAMYQAKQPWSDFKYIVEEDGTTATTETCATPMISYADKCLLFSCTTEGAQYHYTITDDDMKTNAYSESGKVELVAAYNISVYASADGYKNSDMATATLYFINAGLENTGIAAAEKRAVVVQADGQSVNVSGLNDGEAASLYSVSGVLLSKGKATDGAVSLDAGGANGVVILKIGTQSMKVLLK